MNPYSGNPGRVFKFRYNFGGSSGQNSGLGNQFQSRFHQHKLSLLDWPQTPPQVNQSYAPVPQMTFDPQQPTQNQPNCDECPRLPTPPPHITQQWSGVKVEETRWGEPCAEMECEDRGARAGMPACARCVNLTCDCGLCRQCRVYAYVTDISVLNQPPPPPPQHQNTGRSRVKKDNKARKPNPKKPYDAKRSISESCPKPPKILGGPLMSEYRNKYRWPSSDHYPKGEEGQKGGRKGGHKGRGQSKDPAKGGSTTPTPSKASLGRKGRKGPWDPSVRVPPHPYELSLRAAEDKLAQLHKILREEMEGEETKGRMPEIPDFKSAKPSRSPSRKRKEGEVKGQPSKAATREGSKRRVEEVKKAPLPRGNPKREPPKANKAPPPPNKGKSKEVKKKGAAVKGQQESSDEEEEDEDDEEEEEED